MAFLSSLFGGHDNKGGDKWGGDHGNKWGGYDHEESYESKSFDLDLGLSYDKESYHKESEGHGKWGGGSEESYSSKSFDLDFGLSKSFESYSSSDSYDHC